jgi:hypothetical protein
VNFWSFVKKKITKEKLKRQRNFNAPWRKTKGISYTRTNAIFSQNSFSLRLIECHEKERKRNRLRLSEFCALKKKKKVNWIWKKIIFSAASFSVSVSEEAQKNTKIDETTKRDDRKNAATWLLTIK